MEREEPPPTSGAKQVIHVIFEGPEGGDGPEERRQRSRELHVDLVDSEQRAKRPRVDPIAFTEDDLPPQPDHNTEALVVTSDVMGVDVQRVMVDTGSSVNVLYYDIFKKLNIDPIAMTPIRTPLSGFTGDTIQPEGSIRFPMEVRTFPRVRKVEMDFVVVNLTCVHNIILGCPGIAQLGAVI